MNDIDKLLDKIVELEQDLKSSKDKEFIYKDILANIYDSVSILIKRDLENDRFNLGDNVDYKQCLYDLKNSLDEYKRNYNVRF